LSEIDKETLGTLRLAFSRLDSNFAQGLEKETADLFAEDGRLMWPGMDDIVGREAIEAALGEFFKEFDTLAFSPDRQIVELFGGKAFTIGRFLEDLAPKAGGTAQRVHGRLVEMWRQSKHGEWQLSLMLTGRYAENEMLAEESASA
jgi:ketosteroid isomerase-like protein